MKKTNKGKTLRREINNTVQLNPWENEPDFFSNEDLTKEFNEDEIEKLEELDNQIFNSKEI